MCFNAFNKAADLDILEHPVLNFIYYLVSFFASFSWNKSNCRIRFLKFFLLLFLLTVGGDITVFSSSLYFTEVAT